MSLLEELNERYKKLADEAGALDERRKELMLGMNELLPAIWALEADAEKAKHTFDDGEAYRKAATDASAIPADLSHSQASSGEAGEMKACTCHPDDATDPCQRKFAANECRLAAEGWQPIKTAPRADLFETDGPTITGAYTRATEGAKCKAFDKRRAGATTQ